MVHILWVEELNGGGTSLYFRRADVGGCLAVVEGTTGMGF